MGLRSTGRDQRGRRAAFGCLVRGVWKRRRAVVISVARLLMYPSRSICDSGRCSFHAIRARSAGKFAARTHPSPRDAPRFGFQFEILVPFARAQREPEVH